MVAQQDGYTGDVFYIMPDGHFVGDDGFVVPFNFPEFLACFPHYVHNWVKRKLDYASNVDADDWAHDLLIHLSQLPAVSKHRTAGKTDVIMTFDPFQQYGASERRFRSYVNRCLVNKFHTLYGKASKNPLSCPNNISLSADERDEETHSEATAEYAYTHSSHLFRGTLKRSRMQEDALAAGEFMQFVTKKEPEAAMMLHAVWQAGGNFSDARRNWCATCSKLASTMEIETGHHNGHSLGIAQKYFNRYKGKLRELAKQFVKVSVE